jgi:hypothetical protein
MVPVVVSDGTNVQRNKIRKYIQHCLRSTQVLVGWLVSDHLLLRNFGPYGIFMYVRVLITVVMAMLLVGLGFME